MNKEIAIQLKQKADQAAENFSNFNREMNTNNEIFKAEKIIPISEHAAVVQFVKNTGKSALAFFYFIPNGSSRGWRYFFPSDSHILGFRAFEFYKFMLEKDNYEFNFNNHGTISQS